MLEPEQPPQEESKTRRKKNMQALQKIGEVLVKLPAVELAGIPLETALAAAITEARTLKNHEGKRRQLQYIGRLMRDTDLEPIQAALNRIQQKALQNKSKLHATEQWRDQFIAKGDELLQDFLQKFPMTEVQKLRQLIRNAQKDLQEHKNRGHETALFRYLRELIEGER